MNKETSLTWKLKKKQNNCKGVHNSRLHNIISKFLSSSSQKQILQHKVISNRNAQKKISGNTSFKVSLAQLSLGENEALYL